MRSFAIVCLFALLALAQGRPGEQYTDKYDNIDLDEIMENPRLLHPYVKCLLEQGPCTAAGTELKGDIHEALENECAKCNETQKNGSKKVIRHLINKEPEYWTQLRNKYDPKDQFSTKYEKELREITKA